MLLKIKSFFLVYIGMMCINSVAFAGDYHPFWKGTGTGKLLTPEVYAAIIASPSDQLYCSVDAACQAMADVLNFQSTKNGWRTTSGGSYLFDIGQIKTMFAKRDKYLSEGNTVFTNSPVGRVSEANKTVDFNLKRNSLTIAGSVGPEPTGDFDPNQLKDIDLSSGPLNKVPLWSEKCGNPLMAGFVSSPVIAGNYNLSGPGQYQIPTSGGPMILNLTIDASSYSTSTATNTSTQTNNQTTTQTSTQAVPPQEDLDRPGFHPDDFGHQNLTSPAVSTNVDYHVRGEYEPNTYIKKDRNVFWVGAAGFVAGAIGGVLLDRFLLQNRSRFNERPRNADYTCWRQPPPRQQYPYFEQYATPTIEGYVGYGNVPTISNVEGLADWSFQSFQEFNEENEKQNPFLLNGRISSDIHTKTDWS